MRAGGGGEEEPVTKHLEKLLGRQVAEMRACERPEQQSVVEKRPGESAPGHRASFASQSCEVHRAGSTLDGSEPLSPAQSSDN